MSKLNKEEVLQQFNDAYLKKHGKAATIEQKGSWFKVDGGKSLRLGDLADMVQEMSSGATEAEVAAAAEKPVTKKAAPKAKAKAVKSGNGGLSPKQLWAQKLAANKGNALPRGQR
ncbi:hypothetical protein SAMN04488540_106150 [Ferrimonas sediminum]|uniref:Uncharacterized protein n=1 Tax=Ferrimonas sediminum TaxID=718193 RepID=A0A1G8SDN0_9GAMM|nr:hypothetical protein [Ferrimonas sediminum]SDJ27294.1 hypothetical protein SAMN04488540_106150 [Ferrimonas sediminum]